VLHSRLDHQKNERVTQSRLLLDLLQHHQTAGFNPIATGNESWFRYVYPAGTMYVRSRNDVTSCVRSGIGTSKVMITTFLLERGSSFCRLYQRVGNLTKTISSKKFYHHFLNGKGQISKRKSSPILLYIWTTRCAIMFEKSVWNWNIAKGNEPLTQLILPTSARVTFGYLVSQRKTE
jgi:hypothetical protein